MRWRRAPKTPRRTTGRWVTCGAYDLPVVRRAGVVRVSRQPLGGRPGPANTVQVDVETAKKVMSLIDKLEDDDDVQRVSSNLELTAEVAEALEQLWRVA